MTGRFISVVGPSGVGKDTVMRALCDAEPRLHLVRRVITRPSAAGGEDFDGVTEQQFEQIAQRGGFCLQWSAHGLYYGIPADVTEKLAAGQDMLANLSRAQLLTAQKMFARTEIIVLTASTAVLKARLLARGRETGEEIDRRLQRASYQVPAGLSTIEIDNSSNLAATVAHARAALFPNREAV